MKKEEMLEFMQKARQKQRNNLDWIVCVPSITRPNFALGKLLREKCSKEFLRSHVVIFVRKEEFEAYSRCNPDFNYEIVPEDFYGVGYTRDYVNNWAYTHGKSVVFNWDDDTKNLTFMYEALDREGYACTHHSNKADYEKSPVFVEEILCSIAELTFHLFKVFPTLRLGNIRRQRFCGDYSVQETLAHVNKGALPRQTEIWKVSDYEIGRYMKPSGRYHGEDITMVANVLQNKEDLFSIQQFGYDFVSEQISSTVRDPDENSERNRKLHAHTFESLKQWEIKNYLKISKTYPDGAFMYGDIDWRRFYVLHPDRKGGAYLMENYNE